VEYFRLDSPADRLILCHRSQCDDIAASPEIKEPGGEDFACSVHAGSRRYASVLPKGVPTSER
jgi:hypothetical protein